MWDPVFPTRDQTHSLHWKYRTFTTGSPGKPLCGLLFTSVLNHLDSIVIYNFAGVGFGILLPPYTTAYIFAMVARNYLVSSLCLIDPLAAFNNDHFLKMPSSASLLPSWFSPSSQFISAFCPLIA